MFILYRPDIFYGLDLAKEYIPIYVKIVNNELPSRTKLLKSFEIEFSEKEELSKLIEKHDEYMKEFLKYLENVYSERETFEEKVYKKNLLNLKILIAERIIERCEFCEWKCKINRKKYKGFCGIGYYPKISSEFIHPGEEPWITPSHTIFFSGCNFKCVYCQNWDISQFPENGEYIEEKTLAKIIDKRRKEGARNVNFVGGEPTPNLHYILKVMNYVKENIPVVWNSNAYQSEISMKILDGFVDLYLYDFRYGNDECAEKYSKIKNYFKIVTRNFLFAIKNSEISFRLLVLPNHIECCAKRIIDWISKNIKEKYVLNIMDQYRPEYKAYNYKEINRVLKKEEFDEVIKYAKKRKVIFFT